MTGSSELSAAGIEWVRERLQHLQTLSAALASARTEREAIDATLDRGLEVFEADQAVIASLDDTGRRFRIVGTRGYPGSGRVGLVDLPELGGLPDRAGVTRRRSRSSCSAPRS